jgi:hypothetical protein
MPISPSPIKIKYAQVATCVLISFKSWSIASVLTAGMTIAN